MRRVPVIMVVLMVMAMLYTFALAGCGLTGVQKVKLACAESAERLAAKYRGANASTLSELDKQTVEREAVCNATFYRAAESGTADVSRVVKRLDEVGR